ncbi:glycosyltransferase [Knoellia sp. CPCC 206453]|uniref:glycosyltransferase n=1 Tax=Knoellia pratensis TaxID=3404796 RepID=UPI0036102982
MKVGWYVHHHGAGHRTRAMVVGRELMARGADVTLLGSALEGDAARRSPVPSVRLAMDAPLPEPGTESGSDVTAHGMMHWAPLWHSGFRERMTTIARWVQVEEPDVVVVDVSCEVAVMVRLLGIPVVVVAQPGERTDSAHAAAYDAATAVLAPWPAWATEDIWRTSRILGCENGPDARLVAVGGIAREPVARATGAPVSSAPSPSSSSSRLRGLVLAGSDGFDDPDLHGVITDSVPDIDWTVVGGKAWIPDVHDRLAQTDVVVTHAGQNAIADVAGWGLPAVVLPQSRPFDEQRHMGAVLASSGIAQVVQRDDVKGAHWGDLVNLAHTTGGEGWRTWGCQGAAARAASLVEVVAGV